MSESRIRRLPLMVRRCLGGAMMLLVAACAAAGDAERDQEPVSVTFADLGGWTYVEGVQGMPARIKQLSGSRVQMVGLLVPIDNLEASLVSGSTVYQRCDGPEIHQIVHVTLPRRLPRYDQASHAKVTGFFTVGATVLDGYIVDIFQLRAEEFELVDSGPLANAGGARATASR